MAAVGHGTDTRASLAAATQPAERPVLTRTDRLTLACLVALGLAAAVYHPRPLPLLVPIAGLGLALITASSYGTRSRVGRIIHDFFPVLTLIGVFNLTGPVIVVANSARWDATLAALDRQVFGTLPSAWFDLLGRPWWLTDGAYLVYVSYYFIPVAMGAALYVQGRRSDFDALAFNVVAAFLVSYACYFLLPTSGPRVPVHAEAQVLGGSTLSGAIRAFLRVVEVNQLDAFPSGHTALSLVFLAFGWQFFPRWRLPLGLLVGGILFSTVYLSLHYVIDLVAGLLLAALLPVLLPLLGRCVDRRSSRTEVRARAAQVPDRRSP